MNIKDKEIAQLLSDESWKYQKIYDAITDVYAGFLPKISDRKEGSHPAIKLRDISGLKSPFIYECKTFIDTSNIKKKRTATTGDILVVYGSGLW